MSLGTEVDLVRGHTVLDGDPAPPERHSKPPSFQPMSIVAMVTLNMANFVPLTAEIGSGVWETPANLNGFRVLAALLQRRRSPEANQTLHDVWHPHCK